MECKNLHSREGQLARQQLYRYRITDASHIKMCNTWYMHILSSSMSNNSIGEKTGGQESGEKGRGVRARGGCAGGL